MASSAATPTPGVEIIAPDSSSSTVRENSVDVSNINLALDRASQNDFTVGKTEGREHDTSALEGTDLGGEPPQTPINAGHGGGGQKTTLSVPGGARGSSSVQVSNINLLVDTPSHNEISSRQKRNDDEMSTGTMEGREVGGEPLSPRIPVVRETEGDYTAAQIREEREDTDVMVGKEVGGRSITPDPEPNRSKGTSRQNSAAQDPASASANDSQAARSSPTRTADNHAAGASSSNAKNGNQNNCCVIC